MLQSEDILPSTTTEAVTKVSVERIIILGVAKEPTKVTTQGKAIHFVYAKDEQKLTLKLPGVLISENWSITIQ